MSKKAKRGGVLHQKQDVAFTPEDLDDVRKLVEFVLYCQHDSPRSTDISCIVPTAEKLKKRFNLKMVHYDREHPQPSFVAGEPDCDVADYPIRF